MQLSAKLTVHLGENPGCCHLCMMGTEMSVCPCCKRRRGPSSHPCLGQGRQDVTHHGAMGTLGIRKGLGEGQGISCMDAGGMSRCLCPYSCPPAKHNFRRCLTKRTGEELAKAKGCLENPRSLHTVSPSLHHSCAGETLAWSLAPPAQTLR